MKHNVKHIFALFQKLDLSKVNKDGKIKQFYNFINAVKDEECENDLNEHTKKIPEGKIRLNYYTIKVPHRREG